MKYRKNFDKKNILEGLLDKFKKLFGKGLITILPLLITIYIFKLIFSFMGNFIDSTAAGLSIMPFYQKVILFILIIIVIGYLAIIEKGKIFIQRMEYYINKIPIFTSIYATIKDIINMLTNRQTASFRNVVLVEFPQKGNKSLGFLTNENIILDDTKKIAVFIPTTPNPTNGFLIFVDPRDVELLDMGVDEAIKLVMSIGSINPNKIDLSN